LSGEADARKVPADFSNSCKTQFLSESKVTFLAARYMEEAGRHNPAADASDTYVTWPFECVTFDQLLVRIAQRLRSAVSDRIVGTFYFCANSEGTGSRGFHWVSAIVVIKIDGLPDPIELAEPHELAPAASPPRSPASSTSSVLEVFDGGASEPAGGMRNSSASGIAADCESVSGSDLEGDFACESHSPEEGGAAMRDEGSASFGSRSESESCASFLDFLMCP
jgi:hypothetical protein